MNIKTWLNSHVLVICGVEHRITEVELYYYSKEHPDPFTHCHPDQLTYGKFVFHRAGNKQGAKYKGGSFKGLDISLGNGTNYGGLLIRSLLRLDTNISISGPSNCVEYILELHGELSLETLTPDIVLESKELKEYEVLACPRIGLTLLKDIDRRKSYLSKLYRYITLPCHTSNHKVSLMVGYIMQGKSYIEIKQILGFTIERYYQAFFEGYKKGVCLSGETNSVIAWNLGACI